jgi:hypothetical protein
LESYSLSKNLKDRNILAEETIYTQIWGRLRSFHAVGNTCGVTQVKFPVRVGAVRLQRGSGRAEAGV